MVAAHFDARGRGIKVLNPSGEKTQARIVVGGGGEKSQQFDPGFELRLGREQEQGRVKIIQQIGKTGEKSAVFSFLYRIVSCNRLRYYSCTVFKVKKQF